VNDIMENIQDDVFGRINADAPLANVVVLEERKGIYTNDILQVLGTQTNRGGLKGACVVVEMPYFTVSKPDATGPRLDMEMGVRCLEKPLVNRAPGGSGVKAEPLTIRVLQLLHHFLVTDKPITLVAKSIAGIQYESGEREYALKFGCMLQLEALVKLASPTIIANGLNVTVTGPAGASIYYTIDGSYPAPGNAAASLVLGAVLDSRGVPIDDSTNSAITAGTPSTFTVPESDTLVRAVSYPNDLTSQASNAASQTIS
jgi:hypothetical protein